jgi:hypothetical protein
VSYLKQTTKMGAWKRRKINKSTKRSFTRSSIGRLYVAIPPPEGWPGGNDYGKNGARLGRKA